jgi:hypothetical protein
VTADRLLLVVVLATGIGAAAFPITVASFIEGMNHWPPRVRLRAGERPAAVMIWSARCVGLLVALIAFVGLLGSWVGR